jgi:antitoxin CcdA
MSTKKAVNVSMDKTLLAKAKAEGLNLSAELEQTVRTKISSIEAERWKRENAVAIEAYSKRIAEEGVAGEEYRSFG